MSATQTIVVAPMMLAVRSCDTPQLSDGPLPLHPP